MQGNVEVGLQRLRRGFVVLEHIRVSWKFFESMLYPFTVVKSMHRNRTRYRFEHLRPPCDFASLFAWRQTRLATTSGECEIW
jgi:hypothetical protein